MLRRTRGSASLPAPERLGPIISPVHTNDLTLTGNKCLLGVSFLERFLSGVINASVARAISFRRPKGDSKADWDNQLWSYDWGPSS
jgi:hypothetical protein